MSDVPVDLQRAEVIDWWETERARVDEELRARLPGLLRDVETAVEDMPAMMLLSRGQFRTETIVPLVARWLTAEHTRLSGAVESSWEQTLAEHGADSDPWSFDELASAGAALAVTAAPLAAWPAVSGGLLIGGTTLLGFTVAAPALSALAVTGLVVGAVGLGAGVSVRERAIKTVRDAFRKRVLQEATTRVLGSEAAPDVGSLKGTLYRQIDSVLENRLGQLA